MFFTLMYTKKKNQDHECHFDQTTETQQEGYQSSINIL